MTLLELLELIRKHLKLVIILPVVCAIACGLYAYLVMPDVYTADASMYVLTSRSDNSTQTTDADSSNLSNEDLSASQKITTDVAKLIESNRVATETADALNMDISDLKAYDFTVTSSDDTRLVGLAVTGEDPKTAAEIANTAARLTDSVAKEIMGIEAVNIMDEATTPESPSGPHRLRYVGVAFLAGLFAAIAIIVLVDMLDTRVRKPDELEELLELPLIGRVPEIS